MRYPHTSLILILTATFLLLLQGCGGGSDDGDTPTSSTLSGTVAAGAPLVATVVVKDANGEIRSVTTDLAGSYSIDVTGLTPPLVLRAEGCTPAQCYTVHSAIADTAIGDNIVNLTPLTDLIISGTASTLARSYFESGDFSNLSAETLAIEEANLQARLQAVLDVLGVGAGVDLLYELFSADHTGLDAALDILLVTVDTATNVATITNLLTNESITDDLTTTTDNTDPGLTITDGISSNLTALEAITAALDGFDAYLALHPDDWLTHPDLALYLYEDRWLDYGENYTQFISETVFPLGLRLASWALLSLDESLGEAKIAYRVVQATGAIYQDTWWVFFDPTSNTWKMAGNQHKADISVEAKAELFRLYDPNTGVTTDSIRSGIDIYIYDTGLYSPQSIAGAVVNGPGVDNAIILIDTEDLDGYQLVSWNTNMTDNAEYTVDLYADETTILDSYTVRVPAAPENPDNLATSDFPEITQPTPEAFDLYRTSGGDLTVGWSMPASLGASDLDLKAFDNLSNEVWVEDNLDTNSGTVLLNLDFSIFPAIPDVELDILGIHTVTALSYETTLTVRTF